MISPLNRHLNKPHIQSLEDPVFKFFSLEVKVLRIDTMHPIISGNKWMKLLPWLELAKQGFYKGLITKGGPWSNHVHAAAFSAFTENLPFTAIIKAKENFVTPTLQDALNWGANLQFVDQEKYNDEVLWANMAIATKQLYIPMGGEGPVAIKGVSFFFDSIELPTADYVICPVGTGTTFKGIAASNTSYKNLIGINPGINDPSYTAMLDDLKTNFSAKNFTLLNDRSLKKFGKWPASLIDQMNNWYEKWQLPTDIIYTAKMFSIFIKAAAAGDFKPGSSILLIHTGGLQGNRSVEKGLLHF
ncbi:MAG: pyridoxal-phosphate dependent enzyme [Bacteroidota bacterium]